LLHARQADLIFLHAFVVLPDHWHVLLSLRGDVTLSSIIGKVCRHARFGWDTDAPQWQKGFHDHRVRENEPVVSIVRYVESNPIRKGLVKMVQDWRWSSAASAFADRLDRGQLSSRRWEE